MQNSMKMKSYVLIPLACFGLSTIALGDRFDATPEEVEKVVEGEEGQESLKPSDLEKPLEVASKVTDQVVYEDNGVSLKAGQMIQSGVRLTELGRMRAFVILNPEAVGQEDEIHELLSDANFRLFPAKNFPTFDRLNPELLKEEGGKRKADLVYYVKLATEAQESLGDFKLYEGEATAQLYNVITGELIATSTETAKGERSTKDKKARESAATAATKAALESVMKKSLEKVERVIVHEAQFTAIENETEAAKILKAAEKLNGVQYARQMWFDPNTGSLGIELIGAPKTVNDWKAWLENLDLSEEMEEKVEVQANKKLREKYPDWFSAE